MSLTFIQKKISGHDPTADKETLEVCGAGEPVEQSENSNLGPPCLTEYIHTLLSTNMCKVGQVQCL